MVEHCTCTCIGYYFRNDIVYKLIHSVHVLMVDKNLHAYLNFKQSTRNYQKEHIYADTFV